MASLLERLRGALAPDYELERELGGGGMGIVFLARDTALERRVAVKIIRPELATARATERFLREAKTLAHLKHPNIMPVHRAGEAGGFAYFVMDYCEGGTLWERLERGPLSLRETIQLGRQLLDGLEVVHRAGLVHRDIKPANVFFLGGRAVLGDFGLATPETVGSSTPTEPAGVVGTPGYRPPELSAGGTATARTDIYAVGVVLYEAVTCQRWYAPAPEGGPDWSRVPPALRRALRRALAWSPERRWPDAAAFRRALLRGAHPPWWRRLVAGGVTAAAAIAAWFLWPFGAPPPSALRIRALEVQLPGRPGLGDSLADLVAADLTGVPDIQVLGPRDKGRAAVELRGGLRAEDGSLCVGASLYRGGARPVVVPETCASGRDPVGLADSLARLVTLQLWTDPTQLIADLPRNALPGTQRGLAAWLQAEHLFADGRWGEAYVGYRDAQSVDTTCWLCAWRLYWVENWLGSQHDTARFQRFLTHLDLFPPQYQSVMRAGTLPLAQRLDTLLRVTRRYPQFLFGLLTLGEEQFHRAPLLGHWRREALQSFLSAAHMSPAFAPAWEHLTFLATAEGDSAVARDALERWQRITGEDSQEPFFLELRAMLLSSFYWRFRPGPDAQRVVEAALKRPEMLANPDLGAGSRMLLMFDAPAGALWVGNRFAEMKEYPGVVKSGLLGESLGHVVLGAPDSARAELEDLVSRFPEPAWEVFAAEYLGALAHLDSTGMRDWRRPAEAALRRVAESQAGSDSDRGRGRGMLAVLSGTAPDGDAGEYTPLIRGWDAARRQHWREALALTDALVADPEGYFVSPVLRALAHVDRADWWLRSGDPEAAARELRWSEHWHVQGFPSGLPQAADVDWSLRTLARWRLATTLDRAGRRDEEMCLAYRRVANAWADGSPVLRARADSARTRATTLACPAGM